MFTCITVVTFEPDHWSLPTEVDELEANDDTNESDDDNDLLH